jgi:hypothetical protein
MVWIFLFFMSFDVLGEKSEEPYFFYRSDGLGAHAFYTPYTMAIESGFEAAYYRRVDRYPFKRGFRNLTYSLTHGDKVIREYGGYWAFFLDQFVPSKNGAYTPNYTWHLIGGGFRARLLEEYFIDKGYSYPRILSWTTLYLGHLMNEAVQSETADQGSVDALADLLFFDWAGKVLFLYDPIADFCANVLHMTDWTFPMSLDPLGKRLINNGQQYWVRYPIYSSFHLSILTGNIHNSLGFTWQEEDHKQWTLGLGLKPEEFRFENKELLPGRLTISALFAYSGDDNPYWTAVFQKGAIGKNRKRGENDKADPIKLIVNIYPNSWMRSFGITFGSLYGGFFVGIVSPMAPFGIHGLLGGNDRREET